MPQEVKANLGTRLNAEEQKTVDPSKVAALTSQPRESGVVGQAYMAIQVCPYCGCVGHGIESETRYLYFTCHCCGQTFRA
jgi:hypothetical protein